MQSLIRINNLDKEHKPESSAQRVTGLERFCTSFVMLLLAVILLFLIVVSVTVTCTVYGGAEIVEYGADQPILHLLMMTAILIIWAIRMKKGSTIGTGQPLHRQKRRFIIFAGILLIWMLIMQIWAGSDSRMSMESARCLLEGDFKPWDAVGYVYRVPHDPLGYAYTYPSQNGLILYMALISLVFRDIAPYMIQVFNIGFLVLGLVSLGRLLDEQFREEKKGAAALLMMCYLPFSFYYLFVYGTIPGFGLSGFALYRVYRYIRGGKAADFWIAALSVSAAVLLKSNYLIVLVAIFIYLLSESVFKKQIRLAAAAVLLVGIYIGAGRGMNAGLELVTSRPSSGGIPMTAWVEMGLLEGKRGPGWFNNYNVNVFAENDSDTERTKEAISLDLKETIRDMAEDPEKTADFFLRKTQSIWAEPTFQSLWIQEIGGSTWLIPQVTNSLVKEGGILNTIYLVVMNYVQTLVYAGAFLFLLMYRKRLRWEQLIPAVIFIGGFLFHLAWEAKGQYTVFYFLLLIPYAYYGIRETARLLAAYKAEKAAEASPDK